MNRKELNKLVFNIVRECNPASDEQTTHIIEETLFQVRLALTKGAEIDLDYLGVLRKNADGTYTYDPREGKEGEYHTDDEEAAHVNTV